MSGVFSLSVDLVITEGSEEAITIYQVECSNTILSIMLEITLIFDPHFLEITEVIELELFIGLRVIIVYDTSAVKHLVLPLSMISYISTSIIQSSKSIDLSLFPLAIIDPTSLVIELSLSVTLAIFSLSLIPGSIVIVFVYKSVLLDFSVVLVFRSLMREFFRMDVFFSSLSMKMRI